jgi:hypothetical protein
MVEGEEKEKKKRKTTMQKEGFLGARPTLIVVLQVAAVRCN